MTKTGVRTFDCPWCGAISPVPGDHLGEHFACPECKKGTKLTEKNTSTRAATAAPPDAPHLTGDRTFDCPWCGAISSVPSSHLGEGFRCPECAKSTKLTSTNTRKAGVTAPPPDAPTPDGGSGVGTKALAAVVVLAVAGGAVWYFNSGAAPDLTKESAKVDAPIAAAPRGPSDASPAANPASAKSDDGIPAMASESPPTVVPVAGTPSPSVPPPVPDAEKSALAKQMAATKLASATGALEAARAKLEEWGKANPGAIDARDALPALAETAAEIDRRLADKATLPDPSKATPEQIRAADAAVRAFLDASPVRQKAAAAVRDGMRSDHGGREVAGVADWRELHFTGDGFRRASAALSGALAALAGSVPADIEKAVTDAAAARDAAQAELDALGR